MFSSASPRAEIVVAHTADLDVELRRAARVLLDDVFGPEMTDDGATTDADVFGGELGLGVKFFMS